MIKSEIKVEFTIFHNSFLDHQEITKLIGIEPVISWNLGDEIRKNLFRKESAWIYSTGYIVSLDLKDILNSIIQILTPNIQALSEYIYSQNLESKFDIVFQISKDQIPSHFLSKEFINLSCKLNAVIETDIYL